MSVIANERIRHNGEAYERGEVLEGLDEKDEDRLLKLGSASKFPAPSKSKTNTKVKGKGKDGE